MADQSILETSLANFDRVCELLGDEVERDLLDKIRQPKERIELRMGPQLDDGTLHCFRAFVVRHSDALGPAKGGIRMTPTVTLDDVADAPSMADRTRSAARAPRVSVTCQTTKPITTACSRNIPATTTRISSKGAADSAE